MALQIHESVGHAIELDRILGWEAAYAGTSWLDLAQLGALQYGSELMNITIDPTIPGALGSFGFDDEGTPAPPATPCARAGGSACWPDATRLRWRASTTRGSVRADGWARLPMVRMTNVGLEPGPHTLEEIIASTDDGIFMDTNRSWSIDDKRLNFQFGCEIGYEVKDGRARADAAQPHVHRASARSSGARWTCCRRRSCRGARRTAARASRARSATPATRRAGPVPQRPGRGPGVSDDPEAIAAGLLERAVGVGGRRRGRGVGRRQPARAHPFRQLGDPPERRRGRDPRPLRLHRDGRTAPARRPVSTTTASRRSSSGRSTPVAARAPRSRMAGAGPARRGRRRGRRRPRHGDATPRRPGRGRRRLRRRRRRAGDGRLLPHARTAAARSPTRPGQAITGESAEIAVDGIARVDRRRRRRAARLGSAAGRRRRRARRSCGGQGARRRRTRSSCRPTATRWSSSRRRSPTCWSPRAGTGSTRKAVDERVSFVRLGEAQFDPAVTLVDDAPAAGESPSTPTARRTRRIDARRRRHGTVADPRPAHGRRGRRRRRPATASGGASFGALARHLCSCRDGGQGAAAEVDGPDRRCDDRRTGCRRRAGHPRHRPLVHAGARSPHARRHRSDPQRRVAHRGRRGRPAAAQLPLHAVVRPGADAGLGARRRRRRPRSRATRTRRTAPRWTAPALHLASWNFTGGASG